MPPRLDLKTAGCSGEATKNTQDIARAHHRTGPGVKANGPAEQLIVSIDNPSPFVELSVRRIFLERRPAPSLDVAPKLLLATIQRWLGHTNIAQTSTYLDASLGADELRHMQAFEKRVGCTVDSVVYVAFAS